MPFTNTHLSFSRLQRYEQCPRSFKLHYLDGLSSESCPDLHFGKAMHRVLEKLLREHVAIPGSRSLPLERAERLWQEAWGTSGAIGLGAFYEGLRMLRAFVGAEGVVDPASVLAIGKEFDIAIGRFRVVGAIDRVDRTGEATIRVRQYKTSRLLFSREELAENLQLSLYCLAARELWPWAKNVELQFDMLRHDVRLRTSRTEGELDAARLYIEGLGERTEADGEFAPRPGPNCVHCDHKTQCDAYARALSGERTVRALDLRDLETVAREREEVACIAKVAHARKAQLEAVLKARLEETDKLDVGGVRYQLAAGCSLAYPLEPTMQALEEATWLPRETLLARLATIDTDALSKLLDEVSKQLPQSRVTMLRADLAAVAERTLTPRLSAKPVRT